MVGVLIRMKVAVLRHSVTGRRAADTIGGGVLGLALALATIWLVARGWPVPGLSTDLLAAAFVLWTVGWLLGPVVFGGGDEALRPEHLALVPIRPHRLAAGLLAAAFVGVAPLVSLVAFAALVVVAVPLGGAATLVALVAVPLQLLLVVLGSRFVTAALGQLVRSRIGAVLAAVISGGVLALTHTGWVLQPTLENALTSGFPADLSAWVRRLPSGWGVVAVDAASRGEWLPTAGAMAGLAALAVLAALGWSALLVRRVQHRQASGRPTVGAGARRTPRPGAVRAVAARELRTAGRDLGRFHQLAFALVYALTFCLLPLVLDIPVFVPFLGVVFGLWAAAVSANLYGEDGTALWQVLVTPGAARDDVRGRQLGWLAITAPVVVALSVVPTLVSGQTWAWPWLAALVPALLGGGAGLVVLVSVVRPVPTTDPHRRNGNLAQNGTDFTQVLLVLVLVACAVGPAYLAARYGPPWSGAVVGTLTGLAAGWWLGDLAARRLASGGPEMLAVMRSAAASRRTAGGVDRGAVTAALDGVDLGDRRLGIEHAPLRRRVAVGACLVLCWVPLVAQGLVPAVLSRTDPEVRSWFLARHVPEPWQWPTIAVMVGLGLALLGVGLQQLARARAETARALGRDGDAGAGAVPGGTGAGPRAR